MSDSNNQDNERKKVEVDMPPPSFLPKRKNADMPPPPSPPKQQQPQQPQQPPPTFEPIYKEPFWSKEPIDNEYQFEVIKGGVVLENLPINKKAYYLIGRLPICELPMEHPTISRQHAIIQHRSGGQLFLYDLNSTHGSFINKKRVQPNVYNPIKNGDVLKFGESTRLYVVCGGPEQIDSNNSNNNSNNSNSSKDSNGKKSFVDYYMSSEKTSDAAILAQSRDSWLKDDHDDEIRKDYENDEVQDTDDDHFGKMKKKKHRDDDDDDDDDQDENDQFYDRTSQNKDKLLKKYIQLPFNELVDKLNALDLDKIHLQTEFSKSSFSSSKQQETDSQDSLDQFMNENQHSLKKVAQQKIMSSLVDVEKEYKLVESIIKSKPEFRKARKDISSYLKSKEKEKEKEKEKDNKDKSDILGNNTNSSNSNKTTSTSTPTSTATPTTTTDKKRTLNIFKSGQEDEAQKTKKPLILLDDEIPEEYKVKKVEKKQQQTKPLTSKSLKHQQESEFVDLISRESASENSNERYGY
ncbi:hypothetical protein CYY_009550 [Polysphondylium violaceum]|uniref:FHA domain-containing protein n=1 Tax=Polysphondylium violaceum TaxID=133409 RepID=A0A8J4V2U9_9MYCE|nr:hypothetical protein CYY_009550 [Polysphondylium violaceum]